MAELFTLPVLVGILYSGIRLATPYLFAAVGETFAQRSGVLNLGVEGIMLMGAFSGFYVGMKTGNLWLGLLAAALVGLLMGLLMAVISVTLKAEQGISGIGLYMFGLGLSSLLFKVLVGTVKTVQGFPPLKIPLLGDIPFLGALFRSTSDTKKRTNLLIFVTPRIVTDLELAEKERARLEHAASLEGAAQALDTPDAEAAQKAVRDPDGPAAEAQPPVGGQP